MAISTYSELQSAISDWMARSDISGKATDFIALAEARLNRMLEPVSTTASLTCATGSNELSISSLSIIEPTSLFLTDLDEYAVDFEPYGSFSVLTQNGFPRAAAITGTKIVFDRTCERDYAARFVYQGRFALSDAAPTNEFLTNHPDLYLAASIVWGCSYVKDLPNAAMWQQMLIDFESQVKSDNAKKKRGVSKVDNALQMRGWQVKHWVPV